MCSDKGTRPVIRRSLPHLPPVVAPLPDAQAAPLPFPHPPPAGRGRRETGQCHLPEMRADRKPRLHHRGKPKNPRLQLLRRRRPADGKSSGRLRGSTTRQPSTTRKRGPASGVSRWIPIDGPGGRSSLVRCVAEYYLAKGREYLDLSVLHDNHRAIRLYRSLGFRRVPVYAGKNGKMKSTGTFTREGQSREHLCADSRRRGQAPGNSGRR